MTPPTTSSSQSPDQPPARAAATARALIERQLWVLGRLAEAGLNVALAIERQALAAADEGAEPSSPAPEAGGAEAGQPEAGWAEASRPEAFRVVQGDLALAYGRAARAVRLTLALQAKMVTELQALDESEARQQRGERQKLAAARKARVERIVERVIKAEFTGEAEIDRLAEAAYERLEDDDVYGALLSRPVSEIIERVCRDLGLAPDWSRLAEEAWAQEEIEAGVAAAPLLALRWLDPPPLAAGCAADPPPKPARAASP